MLKVLNIYGGPGAGKSTVAAGVFYKLKMQHRSVELVTEFAKDLVYAGTLNSLIDQQEYIFAEQNYRLHRLRDNVELAITDSPILLCTVYAQRDYPCLQEFIELVKATDKTYDNVNIFLERPDVYSKSGRNQNFEEAQEVDTQLKSMLELNIIPFNVFQTGPNVVDEIIETTGV